MATLHHPLYPFPCQPHPQFAVMETWGSLHVPSEALRPRELKFSAFPGTQLITSKVAIWNLQSFSCESKCDSFSYLCEDSYAHITNQNTVENQGMVSYLLYELSHLNHAYSQDTWGKQVYCNTNHENVWWWHNMQLSFLLPCFRISLSCVYVIFSYFWQKIFYYPCIHIWVCGVYTCLN